MKIHRKKRFAAHVATESLSDIMFFLMLFFLIVSTVANPNVIKILLPKSDAADTLSKQQIVVTVTEDRKYFLGKDEMTLEQLEAAVADASKTALEPTMVMRLAKNLEVQDLVDVMKIGVKLKLKVVLATEK